MWLSLGRENRIGILGGLGACDDRNRSIQYGKLWLGCNIWEKNKFKTFLKPNVEMASTKSIVTKKMLNFRNQKLFLALFFIFRTQFCQKKNLCTGEKNEHSLSKCYSTPGSMALGPSVLGKWSSSDVPDMHWCPTCKGEASCAALQTGWGYKTKWPSLLTLIECFSTLDENIPYHLLKAKSTVIY